jgi:hypothetical protein
MPQYRIFVGTAGPRRSPGQDVSADSDSEALEIAQMMAVDSGSAEVWQRTRFLGAVGPLTDHPRVMAATQAAVAAKDPPSD